MLLNEEILQLKQRIKDRREAFEKKQIDTTQEDKFLADLSVSAGWEVLKASIERTIAALLEPGIGGESVDLATIGAITKAREFTIEALQGIINTVESTKSAKIEEKSEQKKKNPSQNNLNN